jgi:hypothetical protein
MLRQSAGRVGVECKGKKYKEQAGLPKIQDNKKVLHCPIQQTHRDGTQKGGNSCEREEL